MNILIDDERDKLTPDIKRMMDKAADRALSLEFSDELAASGIDIDDIKAEIAVTITGDDEIRALNKEHRGIDKVTDVLSFPQFSGHDDIFRQLIRDDVGICLLGDVVICSEQAERQAREYATGITRELLYLFVHSILHLLGYDHEEEDDKRIMRVKEETVLKDL